jgi:probable rRNA maturation factor
MTALIRDSQRSLKTDKRRIRKITQSLLTYLRQQDRDVSILFVSNRQIQKMNREFFGKDRPTNVISFSYLAEETLENPSSAVNTSAGHTPYTPDFPCEMIGDIVISLERAREEADAANVPFHERIFALIIHGLLHIVGYEHENGGSESRRMRYREKKLLDYVTSLGIYKEITL